MKIRNTWHPIFSKTKNLSFISQVLWPPTPFHSTSFHSTSFHFHFILSISFHFTNKILFHDHFHLVNCHPFISIHLNNSWHLFTQLTPVFAARSRFRSYHSVFQKNVQPDVISTIMKSNAGMRTNYEDMGHSRYQWGETNWRPRKNGKNSKVWVKIYFKWHLKHIFI